MTFCKRIISEHRARLLRHLLFSALLVSAGTTSAFDLHGHRGARGLAPENTLAGFATALRLGVTTLEFDLAMTADGVLVVSHDPRLNPNLTRDAQGQWLEGPGPAIRSLRLAELRAYDVGRLKPGTRYAQGFSEQQPADGERIPTLDELLERVSAWGATRVRFNIETKLTPDEPELAPAPSEFADALIKVLRRHGVLERTTVQSFDWRTLREVRRLVPGLSTAALTARQKWLDNLKDGRWTGGLLLAEHGGSVPRLVKASGATIWSPFHGDLTEAALREAQALGLQVIAWTVNDPARIEQLLDWGVDGLISDHPERVRAALAKRGRPLPPAASAPGR